MQELGLVRTSNFCIQKVRIIRVIIVLVVILQAGVVQVGFSCPWCELFRVGIVWVGDVLVLTSSQ